MIWKNKEILITGGAGSLGSVLVQKFLSMRTELKGIRVYSRDEAKQEKLKDILIKSPVPVSFLIGDVRDKNRLSRAMEGCNFVIHTAALKRVPIAEENPIEYIRTNVDGTINVIDCCLDHKIERGMFISTDKAVYPVNLYGATKMCAERVWLQADSYSGGRPPKFSVCRYGNVLGSRGSVVHLFEEQAKRQESFTITDQNMTRFWITLSQAADFVIQMLEQTEGGEIFIPKLPSMKIIDLARVVRNHHRQNFVTKAEQGLREMRFNETGIRPGEKLHECLITEEESKMVVEMSDRYIILRKPGAYWKLPEKSFSLRSDTNDRWLSQEDLKIMLYGKEEK